jgi:hypothetical protein
MARKKADSKPRPDFERIEFHAPIGFQARIDKAAWRRGLSRSAYIRQAVLLLIVDDEKNLRLPGEDQ